MKEANLDALIEAGVIEGYTFSDDEQTLVLEFMDGNTLTIEGCYGGPCPSQEAAWLELS